MKKKFLAIASLVAFSAAPAFAGGSHFSFNIVAAPAPVYYQPAPVYYEPAPVYYYPQRVVYRPPVYYAPRPYYYAPAYQPVSYVSVGYRDRYRGHGGYNRGRGHDRGERRGWH